jgi:pilus assembly protein CpaB
MRTRTWIVLLLALGSGLIAGYAALQLASSRPQQQAPAGPTSTFQVVVAAHDLPVGSILGEEDLRTINWPDEVVPEGYARQIPDVIGRGVIQPMRTNEPVLMSKLFDRGAGGGLPILIPEGMRAVALRVDDVISVAGFVTPGTRVDMMLTIQPPGNTEFITRTIIQNLEVASAGPQYIPDPEGNPVLVSVLTLYVTPEQAEQVALASKQGQIQFALRNQLDVRESRTPGIRLSRLLTLGAAPAPAGGGTRSAPPPATRETGNTLEILRGAERAIVRYGRGGGNQ